MQRVAELTNQGDFRQALVRLWVLAGRREGHDLALNAWERGCDASTHDQQRHGFLGRLIQGEPAIRPDEIMQAPLAFVGALDQAQAELSRSKRFAVVPTTEEGAGYWLVPIALARRSEVPLARQAGNREAWFTRHAVIPARTAHGIEVKVSVAPGRMDEALGTLAVSENARLTAWIGHFADGARLQWDPSAAGRFRLRGIEPADQRKDSIHTSLEQAATVGAQVVLFPEFTVDLQARLKAADWLVRNSDHPFFMIVAGSFHQQSSDGWYNTAELWNRHAEPVLTHCKLRVFGAAAGLAENVSVGNCLNVLVTPIGTFALLICKDFMDDHVSVAGLLQEVPVDWVLVPSYGDDSTLDGHRERALQLAKVGPGTSSFVANQRNVELAAGDPLPGFGQPSTGGDRTDVGLDGGAVSIDFRSPKRMDSPGPPAPSRLKRIK